MPSLQAVPDAAGDHAVRVIAVSQVRHAFDGFAAPDARQTPAMRQPDVMGESHRSAPSLQVSVVQLRPSEQSRALPVHAPEPLHPSETVQ